MRDSNGNYVVERMMGHYGAVLKGVGATKEEARANLKNEIKKYREANLNGSYLQETGETRKSPGFVFLKSDNGGVSLRFDPNRQVKVMARPDLAAYIKSNQAK